MHLGKNDVCGVILYESISTQSELKNPPIIPDRVVMSAEHWTSIPMVVGSIPPWSRILFSFSGVDPDWKVCKMRKGGRSFTENMSI